MIESKPMSIISVEDLGMFPKHGAQRNAEGLREIVDRYNALLLRCQELEAQNKALLEEIDIYRKSYTALMLVAK